MKKSPTSRRKFVKKLTGTALVASAVPQLLASKEAESVLLEVPGQAYSANDQVQIAAIGTGIMGMVNMEAATQIPGIKLVAACDLYDGRLERMKELYGKDLVTTRRYKEILDRKDIDAVVISTSDHWHDRISMDAMNAGKAVYCEKPMVHKLDEGKAVIDTEKKTGMVFQVGSQSASSILNFKARELYQQGVIGELVLAETYNDRQGANGAWQYSIPPDASSSTVDWDAYLGDAPKRDWDPLRFFRWRNYQEYGTGVAGDLFVHLFTAMHLILESNGPNRIFASGGLRYWKDGRDVPDVVLGVFDYPKTSSHPEFNLQMRVNFVDGGGGGSMTKLVGTEGTMEIGWTDITVKRSKIKKNPGYGGWDSFGTFSEATQKDFEKWYAEKYPPESPIVDEPGEVKYSLPANWNENIAHHTTFYNAIRGKGKIIEDSTFGFRAAAPSLAANVSYFEKRIVNWDPDGMKVLS